MSFIKSLKKNKAIKAYITQLPKLLAKDYGKSEFYTPAQIKSTLEREKLPLNYAIYAIALFSEQDAFSQALLPAESNRINNDISYDISYEKIRHEIADAFFEGRLDFTTKHIIAFSPDYIGAGSFGASWGEDVGGASVD